MAALSAAWVLPAVAPLSAAEAATPKAVKNTRIVAPGAGETVRRTLGRSSCRIRVGGRVRGVRVYVTGPLQARSPKTKRLRSKTSRRTIRCSWKTKSFEDGRYRFVVKAKVRTRGRWAKVSRSRYVRVENDARPRIAGSPRLGTGKARFVARLESKWDPFVVGADAGRQAWTRTHFSGVVGHAPFFDQALDWSPPAIAYKDLYAIYRDDSATLAAHPDWVLRDAAGQMMTIPWGCDPGPCPQFAGDIGNPQFRARWIAEARSLIRRGYAGLWIDDANMEMRVSDERGTEKAPIDPRTGREMTFSDWRRYMADFLQEVRRELPEAHLVANALWFGGTSVGRDSDKHIRRAYMAMDRLNLERGFNDDGLTNGSAPRDIWSVDAFMRFIDRMHDRAIPVTLDSAGIGERAWEYNLAGYFLVDRGEDQIGEMALNPGQWWRGFDTDLGDATSSRKRMKNGVYYRRYKRGIVLLNPPRGEAKRVRLPRRYKTIAGDKVRSVRLEPGTGAVLRR